MISIKHRRITERMKTAAAFAASLAAGALLSGTKMAGIASFADISLAGAVGLPYAALVFSGALIRSIIGGSIGHNIVKLSSLALIVIIKMFLEPKNDPKLCGVNTAVSVFVSGTAVSAVIGELLNKLLFYAFYGGLAGFTAYSAAVLIMEIKKRRVIDLSGLGGYSYAVIYAVFTASLCSLELPLINIGIAAGAAFTLLGAYFYRHTGGVICGALTVCGAFLASPSTGMPIVLLPAAGLLAGFLHGSRSNTAAMSFVGTNIVLMILTGGTTDSIGAMIDIICGAAAFIPVSSVYSDKWIITDSRCRTELSEIIGAKMAFLSDTVAELRRETGRLSDMLNREADEGADIEENRSSVCSVCYRRPFCWQSDRGNTARGFSKLSQMTEFASETFPAELEECIRKNELMDAFSKTSREKAAVKLLDMRFSESRELLSEQLKITEELIRSAGERIDLRFSESMSRRIEGKLKKFGIEADTVIACYNRRSRLIAEIYFGADTDFGGGRRICDLVADELHIRLECGGTVRTGTEVRMCLFEKPRYEMEVYAVSSCADEAKENGDTYAYFTDGSGKGYVVLSDGMGTGREASFQSRIVTGLFRRLVSSGVDHGSAVKLINSIMVTKSQDETFATLDAAVADLDEGGLVIVKSGAAPTIIRHGGGVLKIASPTFPIGIYQRAEMFSRRFDFDEGDIAIMFSDGISENAYPFIKELLTGGDDMKHIVDEISRKAGVFNPGTRSDDVTVLGLRIVGNKE
ncbi:MAG: SpoIIE family protein phosphatase [Ruminococcus sp.]|nr:SpoIIE family protein phosphatase [Ruminococcus sp.]